jgi:hypothetical protein
MLQLAKQEEALKEKGVTVVTVQASPVDEATLKEWTRENTIAFPVGMIRGDEEKTRLAWGVKALPWLIVVDKERVVRAEGFAISELDKHLEQVK